MRNFVSVGDDMIKQKLLLIICLVALILPAVSAGTTYSGTVGQSSGYASLNYGNLSAGWTATTAGFWINDIENSQDTVSYIHFDMDGHLSTFYAGAPNHAEAPFNLTVGGVTIGTGTIGYQRNYDTAWPIPNEIAGYQYMVFTSWDPGNKTGDNYATLNYNTSLLYGMAVNSLSSGQSMTAGIPSGSGGWIGYGSTVALGYHTWNKDYQFSNEYSVEQGDDMLLTGTVSKTVGGTTYNSRGMVFRADTGALVASESLLSGTDYTFLTPPRNIIIGARDARGTIWNTSVLVFSDGTNTTTPTPTPSPTITPYPTTPGPNSPIPAGYIRSTAECVNGQMSRIHDCQIQLHDSENGSWVNYTGSWGYWFIDTLPGHTIDAYGQATGYEDAQSLSNLAASDRMISLFMYPEDTPDAPTGYVTLFITVKDYDTMQPLSGVQLSVRDSAQGYTEGRVTGSSGVVDMYMTNDTLIYIDASKAGYNSASTTITTSDFGPDTKLIELRRATVVTPTTVPTGVTTQPTIDPAGTPDPAGGASGYSTAKGQQMLDWLAANGMSLVQLCFMVTVMALLGVKLGK